MWNLIEISSAQEIIQENFGQLSTGVETVNLGQALGRVLAGEVTSREFTPGFNRATVDGYAVNAADLAGCSAVEPVVLEQIGESVMGAHTRLTVGQGQCVYIATGAEVPAGADTVVMIEDSEVQKPCKIAIKKTVAAGMNMIFRGEDVKAGDVVFKTGKRLNVADLGTLAALGITEVPVKKRPIVAIISTGNELVAPDQPLLPGQIRDVNTTVLLSSVIEAGCTPNFMGIICDDKDEIKDAIIKAAANSDLVIVSGSSSVGKKDVVPEIVAEIGEVYIHGISIKPGRPTLAGRVSGKPIFGLPGNPVAVYFTFRLFVRPLLCSMTGRSLIDRTVSLPLAKPVVSGDGREEFIPVEIMDGLAHPIPSKSGLIRTLSKGDGYIRIAGDPKGVGQGEMVTVTLFDK